MAAGSSGEGKTRYGADPTVNAIDAQHLKAHVFATELLKAQARGEALDPSDKLAELHRVKEELLLQLNALGRETTQESR